jgi:hypothetical protein|tara:strand:+ start:13 stop:294 length:282 start_codon:yes stop_codon:yes gene_type:complete
MKIKPLIYVSCFIFSACSIQLHSQYIPKKPKRLYNYSDITGKKHIFDKEVFKLRETEYLYCYEHKTLHKMEVIPYKKLTGNPILKAKKGNPEG